MGVDRRLLQHHRRGAAEIAAQVVETPSGYFQKYCNTLASTSPSRISVAAQTKAEAKFATWKRQNGISKMPATSGTEARSGPVNLPMKMPSAPHFRMKASPLGIRSGCRES